MKKENKMKLIKSKILPFALLIFAFVQIASAQQQTTNFTYQGRLTDGTMAANGNYDLRFALFDNNGTQFDVTRTQLGVPVTNGIFTVQLSFGAAAFPDGNRVLEISVRRAGETGEFTTLTPRQPITSTPYAIRAINATNADAATNAQQLGGTAANQFVQTSDTRLSDARTPTAGSNDYIQNQNAAAQTSSNFSISGTGAANVFNAATQYNIGGNRAFTLIGDSTIASLQAGENATGLNNSFYGKFSGRSTSGNNNSFFGFFAGNGNTTGGFNSFFGQFAGSGNTTGGQNAFFGRAAGQLNQTGSNNSALGTGANMGAVDLTFATAIGSDAIVSSSDTIVLGKTAGSHNGATRPADAVQIPGTLTVAGNVTTGGTLSANIFNATTQYNIGGSRALRIDSNNNAFIGSNGGQTTGGSNNSYFGVNTGGFFNGGGGFNTTGSNNTLVGANATMGFPDLEYATAIGSGARVNVSNTIQLGRENGEDQVLSPGKLLTPRGIESSGGISLLGGSLRLLASTDSNNQIYYSVGALNGIVFSVGDNFRWFNVRNNRNNMYLFSNGDLGIFGTYGSISDARYKTDVQTFGGALDTVRRLRGVTFNWKPELNKGSDRQIGFIAQEVEAVLPELVKTDEEGYKSVAYSNAVPVLVEAVKEQQTQIEAKQEQLDALREQIKQQQTMIDGLKKLICADKPNADVCKQT